MKHILKIKPAIDVPDRHLLEFALQELGYKIYGGGTMVDGSASDISFESDLNAIEQSTDSDEE